MDELRNAESPLLFTQQQIPREKRAWGLSGVWEELLLSGPPDWWRVYAFGGVIINYADDYQPQYFVL